ncbi:MAG: NUDIX domain-containing protein [Thermodesulfobacteriota bacterium]
MARLKRGVFFTVIGIMASIFPAASAALAAGAGVLIYTVIQDRPYVLLADHRDHDQVHRGWGGLGGTVEAGEAPFAAAVREVSEESNGVFSEADLVAVVERGNKVSEKHFTTFFAQSNFQPASQLTYAASSTGRGVNSERGPFAWLPWSVVLAAAGKADKMGYQQCKEHPVAVPPHYLPDNRQTSWFYCAFLQTVSKVEAGGGLKDSSSGKRLQPVR